MYTPTSLARPRRSRSKTFHAGNPDFILAGPIGKNQIASESRWRIVRAARENKILVVDTLLVARPSVRLGEAAVSLANLLHPGTLR